MKYQDQMESYKEQFKAIGVELQIQKCTGDSAYPTEYSLRHGKVSVIGPTLDMAVREFEAKAPAKGQELRKVIQ
jgi:hypothetical protein